MPPDEISMVQTSFKKVVPIADTAADLFYDRLFAIAPATAATNLHQEETIHPAVENLGKRHVAYGVTAQHYEPVGAAPLWTLEQGLGPDFTPPAKAAWTAAYMTLSGTTQGAAASA